MKGEVISGKMEGSRFLSLPYYVQQIQGKLGFTPFPGTLNVQLSGEVESCNDEGIVFDKNKAIVLEGSEKENLGRAFCWKAKINGADCIILRPEKTSYGANILEIIAGENLRGKLNLSDGSEVEIELVK